MSDLRVKRVAITLEGTPPPWLPTDIGGCVFYLRSDLNITKDGSDRISLEGDQSGNGNDFAQTTDAKKFVWWANQLDGYPAIYADGIDDFEQCINQVTLTPFSIFFIGKRVNDNPIFTYGTYGQGAAHTHQYYSAGDVLFSTDITAINNWIPAPASDYEVYHCAVHRWGGGGTQCTFFRNGVEKTVTGGNMNTVTPPQNMWLGNQGGNVYGSFWRVEIAVYDNIISEADVTNLWNYAHVRYPSI